MINDEPESLKKRVTPPIPPLVLTGKDANGLTPLHKVLHPFCNKIAPTQILQAAGLGRHDIAEYIVSEYPSCINMTDVDGRTPLHYASLLKDDGKMTTFLLDNGADESVLDNVSATIPLDPR